MKGPGRARQPISRLQRKHHELSFQMDPTMPSVGQSSPPDLPARKAWKLVTERRHSSEQRCLLW